MYSVVLMAALTAGGQTADHHGCFSCGSCYGGCNGNYGIDSWNCYGGGYGNSYGSCWGSCNGCWGSYDACWGAHSCCGGCYGANWSTYGCNGCWGAYNEVSPYFVEPPPAVGTTAPPKKPDEALPPPTKPGDTKPPEAVAPSRARLIVDAPADAKLYIDDTAMKTTLRASRLPDAGPGAGTDLLLRAARGVAARRQAGERDEARAGPGRAGSPRRLHGHGDHIDRPGEVTRTGSRRNRTTGEG